MRNALFFGDESQEMLFEYNIRFIHQRELKTQTFVLRLQQFWRLKARF